MLFTNSFNKNGMKKGRAESHLPSRNKSISDFAFRRSLGKGSYGSVYLAEERSTGKEVAIKAVDLASLEKPNGPIEFHPTREVKVCQYLNLPNVVEIYEYFETEQTAFVVMECLKGGDLFDAIKPDFGLPEFKARKYICQLVKVLAYMHERGIVHRDIKPENVMIDKDDNIRLIDFGMAGPVEEKIRSTAGTVPYMPPELYAANKKCSRKHGKEADVWAAGVLLFTMVAGNFAWRKPCAKSDKSFRDFVEGRKNYPWNTFSPRLLELFSKMLAICPEDRCEITEVLKYINDDWFVVSPTVSTLEKKAQDEDHSEVETEAEDYDHSEVPSLDVSMDTDIIASEAATPNVPNCRRKVTECSGTMLRSVMEVDESHPALVNGILPTNDVTSIYINENDGLAPVERPKSKHGSRRNSLSSKPPSSRSRRNSVTLSASVVLLGLLNNHQKQQQQLSALEMAPDGFESKYAAMKHAKPFTGLNSVTYQINELQTAL